MKKIIMDTHIHSSASDGVWRPSEVVKQAKNKGLEVIALTDHDTVFGIEEAVETGEKIGLRVVPGIEIDVKYEKNGIKVGSAELLGLNINPSLILPFTEKITQIRREKIETCIDNFNNYISSSDFEKKNKEKKYPFQNVAPFSIDDLADWKKEKLGYDCPFFSKLHFMFYLFETFAVPCEDIEKAKKNDRESFHKCRRQYKFLFDIGSEKPFIYEAIKIIHDAGGLAVLPHPGTSKFYKDGLVKEWENQAWFFETKDFTPYDFIKDLKEHGLDGVEIYYYEGSDYKHDKFQDLINKYFKTLAEELGLITTYGSDCHGPKGKGPQLGKFGSDKIYL